MASVTERAFIRPYSQLLSEKFTVPISHSVALDVYSNTKPRNLKIGPLQKGLVLIYDGRERIGEGAGFGFPVVIYPKETYFSGSAEVWVKQEQNSVKIMKVFAMDRLARNKVGNVHLENQPARALIRVLTNLYQKNRHLRYLALKELIVNMGVQSTFVKTASMGKVPVTYTIKDSTVDVEVDFRQLRKPNPRKIFMLNEQSANFFTRCTESNGAIWLSKQVGAWDAVNTDSVCLTDLQGKVGYRLWNVDGCILRRGRETMKNCLDWSGLDYEVDPRKQVLEYRIEILGGKP